MTEVSTSVNKMLLLHYGPCKNLKSISVNDSNYSNGIDHAPLRHLYTALANAPNLKFLDLAHYNIAREFKLEIFTDRTVDEDWAVTAAVQKETNASHLRNLVPHLKRLVIDHLRYNESLSDRFDFVLMNQCWCQLRRLDLDLAFDVHLLERLASMVQAKHIQSLSVAGTITDASGLVPLQWIRSFAVLNDLSLSLTCSFSPWSYKECPLNLTDLLDVLSGVQFESLDKTVF